MTGSAGAAAGGWIGFGCDAGGGLLAEPDVAAEAGQVLVAGLGLELGGGAAGGSQVLEGRMAQLVQGPPCLVRVDRLARLLEQVLGARVGQPAPPGLRAGVLVGGRAAPGCGSAPAGEEHRAGGAPAQQPGQQAGGAGGPVDVLDGSALGLDAGPPELRVEVLHVEGEDLLRASGSCGGCST